MKRRTDSLSSRRIVLQAGLAAGAAAMTSRMAWPAAELPLITKPIPSTGQRIPVIGLGTIWYRDANYEALKQVIRRLFELGGSLIDTAAIYGESEGVVGRALAELGLRNKAFLATKFASARPVSPADLAAAQRTLSGPGPGGVEGPPPGILRPLPDGVGGEASFQRSLERLRTDHVELLQVHNMADCEALLPRMLEWKQAKKLRYVGVSGPAAQPARLIEVLKEFPLDFVQLDYSLDNRAAENGALQACQEHRAAVLINLPLARNGLIKRAAERPLPPWAAELDIHSWAQFFLKYVVSQPAVTCAIPGTSSVAHLEEDLHAGRGRLADSAQLRRMAAYWDAA